MDFSDLKDYVTLSKDVVELLKSAYSALPKGAQRNEVERKVKAAEELMRRADVQLAQDLGGRLCHCTWPPQIMLYKQAEGVFQCPNPGVQ